MIFEVVKQFVRRLDKWSIAQTNCKLLKKQQKEINFLWRVCVIILYFGSNFHKFFMESLILAQSERWRRA